MGKPVKPFAHLLEGGVTELVGINEEVNTSDYGGSVGVVLSSQKPFSGELLSFAFFATEDGTGAVQDSAGILYIFDADPAIAVGDTAITNAQWLSLIGKIVVAAADWVLDANGGMAYKPDVRVPFHDVKTLYFAWFHTDAQDLNDAAEDDEQLEFNFWFRRDS